MAGVGDFKALLRDLVFVLITVQWGVESQGTLARNTTFDSNTYISSTTYPIRL
jgi:hypothetical protein